MEYKRKKVEKIKIENPNKRSNLKNVQVRRSKPERPVKKARTEPVGDVGFDVDDIPMAPQNSGEIKQTNLNTPPKHRDIRFGANKKPTSAKTNQSGVNEVKRGVEFKVVLGGKWEQLKERKKTLAFSAIAIVSAFVLFIVALATPASLLELTQNNFTSWSRGDGMPVKVSGGRALGMKSRNGTIFVLTDTRVSAFNSSGKQIQIINHGYSNPELYISDSRTLVYDRGGAKLRVDTLNTNIANKTLSQKIITASLSDNGKVGVITEGDKSPTQLVVANKTFTEFSAWVCSDRLTAVAMSRNGKKAAVSAVVSEAGIFKSTVYLLDISGKTISQIGTLEFSGIPIVTLETVGNRCVAIGTDTVISFDFNGGNRIEKKVDYLKTVNFESKNRVIITNNPSNNVQQTQIVLTDKKLTEKLNITVGGNIDYACASDDGIAVISNHTLITYNKAGEEISRQTIGYEGTYLTSYLDGAAVLADMQLDYYKYREDT